MRGILYVLYVIPNYPILTVAMSFERYSSMFNTSKCRGQILAVATVNKILKIWQSLLVKIFLENLKWQKKMTIYQSHTVCNSVICSLLSDVTDCHKNELEISKVHQIQAESQNFKND